MSNHYHVVLHVDKSQVNSWTRDQIIQRWHQVFTGHLLSQRYWQGEVVSKAELEALDKLVEIWCIRLGDISWFMRVMNEAVAREANNEDDCTGRFYKLHPCSLPFGPANAVQI